MLLGTYESKLDDKGRIFPPAKFREDMEGGIVLTRGQEHCVYIFPASQFEEMMKDLTNTPLSSKQARDWIRAMLSGAYKGVLDKQECTSVPADLRTYAGLDRKLTAISAGSRAEIWSAKAWREYLAVQEEVFSQTAEETIPGMFWLVAPGLHPCSDITSPMAEPGGGPGSTSRPRQEGADVDTPDTSARHTPVFLDVCLDMFVLGLPDEGRVLVDCTLGTGGRSETALKRFHDTRFTGIDRDPQAIALASQRLTLFADRFTAA